MTAAKFQNGVWKDGTGRGRHTPKGRQLDSGAFDDVRELLGDRPRRRDLLIEYLHLIQDNYGYLSDLHLHALAEEMRISMAEIFEVATFYAHFDVVREGETPPPPLTVRVCDSLSCELAGSAALFAALTDDYEGGGKIRVVRAPCMGRCEAAPTLEIGHNHIDQATPDKVAAAVDGNDIHPHIPSYQPITDYMEHGGYQTLKELRAGRCAPSEIEEKLLASGLRGLGGAGFPAGRKWSFVRAEDGIRYLAVNGDEGEPGTFKDRHYLESEPHLFLEGTLIAAWAIEAEKIYIYMRDEYPAVLEILRNEISALETIGLIDPGHIDLRRGAGAYICGEESAMIESIEGKRGLPRHRPPFVAQCGIFGRPTLVQNVETLYWVARVCREGPGILNEIELNGRTGLRSYSVSGRVNEPGVKLLPAGSTITDIIEASGGMLEGHTFMAYQPGGPSSGLLPATIADAPLDFDTLQSHGSFIGSAAVVVLSDQDSARSAALNMLRFFE
ncbi:MAG: NAD(P)H-dependent oxidoreductase subunit E, partial [Alphaproteobacteria bacterium]|nr:NAD(P)H-dependent oxidoreductase subunit E [Alphaproteobacteria bacterium]